MDSAEGHRLLRAARKLVAASWTQNSDARATDGTAVDAWEDEAVTWSLLGALVAGYERLLTAEDETVAVTALAVACVLLGELIDMDSLVEWNDLPGRTQADVLAVIDAAAKLELRSPAEPRFSAN